jgi:hypothetical protein
MKYGRFNWRPLSFQNLALEGYALGVVFSELSFRSVSIRKHLEMIVVSDLLAGVDVNPDCFHKASQDAGVQA